MLGLVTPKHEFLHGSLNRFSNHSVYVFCPPSTYLLHNKGYSVALEVALMGPGLIENHSPICFCSNVKYIKSQTNLYQVSILDKIIIVKNNL